ncbi:GNAT family N-acetyltransferase [Modestobacter sp. DSM 44400]|uniref:GNAT family N-acetyltransferase n=1 Tax=Modestobacter sp. DSM 44400 TaxID=1550230 RepID=UPI00111547CE|nr:GNAT family N-acetyltransferase [Modestobacter sp. DSM 44400]
MRSADERMAFLDVLIAGYATPVEVQRFLRAEHSAGAVRCFTAWADGKPVGAAAMSVHGRTAVLGGAATLPHHRGCGVQAALLGHRLRAARCAGAVAATATAAPGSPSARNLVRSGFHLEPRTGWNRPA